MVQVLKGDVCSADLVAIYSKRTYYMLTVQNNKVKLERCFGNTGFLGVAGTCCAVWYQWECL